MGKKVIDQLIINSPYEEPKKHWHYDHTTQSFELRDGRRKAGYVVATPGAHSPNDPGIFYEIELVNKIRPRVKKWREAGYKGVTGITRRLLDYWNKTEERDARFFFCQLEAIETLIWLAEGPETEKVGVSNELTDGGAFTRICSKMATGSGKTVVMAMLIAWQVLNKVSYPQDSRFTKYVLIVSPGLTVKNRLSVLQPSEIGNYYDEFSVAPTDLYDSLRQAKIRIINWHKLGWESEEQLERKRTVDKRGVMSDEAYTRMALRELSRARNILVINDEGHHAWRVNYEALGKYERQRDLKDSAEEATVWIGGLDRINKTRGILGCYDFSATPYTPSGRTTSEEALFGWIVSDFGLNDAIESGLVKTPRIVVRDDALKDVKTYKSKLYHIYTHVRDDLNRRAQEQESLPDLVANAYYLLGKDWVETKKAWEGKQPTPPVMITVANRTETAARIKHSFDHNKIKIDELCEPDGILHIDSKVLGEAETREEEIRLIMTREDEEERDNIFESGNLTKKQLSEVLRKQVDTVGKPGELGAKIQNVISVGMLSEGWDAKTVTHIMGLRAFSSQLLCEQVIGRGLRRTCYEVNPETGLYSPEYVNVFGVPFNFLPFEGDTDTPPPPPIPKVLIRPEEEKSEFEIIWPNVIRIDTVFNPRLTLDISKVEPIELDADSNVTLAELAPVVEGKPDTTKISSIDLEELAEKFRFQKIAFEAARDIFDLMSPGWEGDKGYLLMQIIKIAEEFVRSDRIIINPPLFNQDELRRRLIITLSMSKIVQHIWEAIKFENTERTTPIYDKEHTIRSTSDMRPWYTGKPCEFAQKSHINLCVYDSTWEASESFQLDKNEHVKAWVKNDHLGFVVHYIFDGEVRKYRPDYLIRLVNGENLILEVKGQETDKDRTKRKFLEEWVKAVNEDGRFGKWNSAVSFYPHEVEEILEELIQ